MPSIRFRRAKTHTRAGLTLLELVVVLAIMAALATVAMRTTTQYMDQSRFEASQRTLTEIQTAVVGPANASSSTSAAQSCFVADMGRLPKNLDELLHPPADVPLFDVVPVNQVLMPRGWRGPYLRLPIGGVTIRDGWGRNVQPEPPLPDPDADPLQFFSLGADNLAGGTGYAADLNVIFPKTPATYEAAVQANSGALVSPPPTGASITIQLRNAQGQEQTGGIKIYRPDMTEANGVKVYTFPTGGDAFSSSYVVASPIIGPVAVCAVSSGGAVGAPAYANVRPGEMVTLYLTAPADAPSDPPDDP